MSRKPKLMKKNQSKSAIARRRNKAADARFQNAEFRTINVLGVELTIVEKRREFFVIGDYPAHIEKHMDKIILALLDGESIETFATLDKSHDIEMIAATVRGA